MYAALQAPLICIQLAYISNSMYLNCMQWVAYILLFKLYVCQYMYGQTKYVDIKMFQQMKSISTFLYLTFAAPITCADKI